MMTFLLIYTHIAALVLGLVLLDWWKTRGRFWVDVWALVFIVAIWPWALWLIIQNGRPKP